ncbi:Manganese ABC transporter substrate-binding lipoprotein precursor [Sulfitobacter sp. THAF37]|uniref:metal ABC transporter substrate-binding protein n=1 Tax=Sulfitobacter sp. THAF37 TaxID=2587855 RepID=UPI0012685E9F|nr:metal ABC transporter substrate-binding protein [Sulfitobacter sp. THAF37]QFT59333.1 Manganese ABC transporter substrate-binding lipoprotein precursor [Sulfitobacter sp. THAF37]
MLKRLVLSLVVLAGAAGAQERPVVAAVNYPLAWMAERLGGSAIEVLFPVPDGQDPSFWRPGLSEIAAIQRADVIALNGAGFAGWTARTSLPRSRVVDTSAGFSDAYIATESVTHSHGADGEHSHTGIASYTWLDFAQAARQAEALAAAMQRRILAATDGVAAALPALTADLEALDGETRKALAGLQGTTILATHPRYQYLARAYGLKIDALDWEAGAMPDADQWQALNDRAAETGATLLIWEAAPPPKAIDRAADMGLRSVVFAPLATRPTDGDFLSVMRAQVSDLAGNAP